MQRLGISWVSFEGRRFEYWTIEKGEHYELIVAATRAKVEQSLHVREILLATRGLRLRSDHRQEPGAPPAWRYFEILTEIRDSILPKLILTLRLKSCLRSACWHPFQAMPTSPEEKPKHELFHRLADPASAEVRRLIVERGFKGDVDFRNIDVSKSAAAELQSLTGALVPPCLKLADGRALKGLNEIRAWIEKGGDR